MAASKKDYEMIAAVFAAMHDRALTHREHTLLASVAVQISNRFRLTNVAFDHNKFVEAAGATKFLRELTS